MQAKAYNLRLIARKHFIYFLKGCLEKRQNSVWLNKGYIKIVFLKLLMIDKPIHDKIAICTCLTNSQLEKFQPFPYHKQSTVNFDPGKKKQNLYQAS